MRRLPRVVLHSLGYFSLFLLLLVIILWMRSYFIIDELAWTHRDIEGNYSNNARRTSLFTGAGRIFLHEKKTLSYEIQLGGLGSLDHRTLKSYWDRDVRWFPETAVNVPFWVVAILVAIPSCIHFLPRRRHKPGLCSKCGYDLRATPNLCPECGHSSVARGGFGVLKHNLRD